MQNKEPSKSKDATGRDGRVSTSKRTSVAFVVLCWIKCISQAAQTGRAGWQAELLLLLYIIHSTNTDLINGDDVLDGGPLGGGIRGEVETPEVSPRKVQLGSDRHDAQRSVARQPFKDLPCRVNRASQPVWIVKSHRAQTVICTVP